ncbi:hypothetical protein [Streptomyces sp. NPDC058579]|uniref:hypothetical protein n=1 Tax=Streptomyces sp. NPDC058579 TaxID=3346548 RepID=UPI00365A1B53
MPGNGRSTRRVSLLLGVALSVGACSGGGSDGSGWDETAQAALTRCERLFGVDNVEAVRAHLGSEARFDSNDPDRIKADLLKTAEEWTPGGDDLRRVTYQACLMKPSGDEYQPPVIGTVKWSLVTMDWVSTGEEAAEWRKVADDVYVQSMSLRPGLTAVLPCTLPGTAKGQGEQLPLEVSVHDEGLGKASGELLTGRLLASLARNTHELLGCEDVLSVPDTLSS